MRLRRWRASWSPPMRIPTARSPPRPGWPSSVRTTAKSSGSRGAVPEVSNRTEDSARSAPGTDPGGGRSRARPEPGHAVCVRGLRARTRSPPAAAAAALPPWAVLPCTPTPTVVASKPTAGNHGGSADQRDRQEGDHPAGDVVHRQHLQDPILRHAAGDSPSEPMASTAASTARWESITARSPRHPRQQREVLAAADRGRLLRRGGRAPPLPPGAPNRGRSGRPWSWSSEIAAIAPTRSAKAPVSPRDGPIGTAITPALAAANIASARSTPVGRAMTTRSPGETPERAQRGGPGVGRASSSAQVASRDRCDITAGRSGWRRAAPPQQVCHVCSGVGGNSDVCGAGAAHPLILVHAAAVRALWSLRHDFSTEQRQIHPNSTRCAPRRRADARASADSLTRHRGASR